MEEQSTKLSADTSLSVPSKSQVGYGRPPSHSQFKPGRSGNPNGRPKGSKSIAFLLKKHLFSMVAVRENGRERRMTKLDVGLTKMANRFAATGDPNTFDDLSNLLERPEAQAIVKQRPLDIHSLTPYELTLAAIEQLNRQSRRLSSGEEFTPRRSYGEPAWYEPPVIEDR